MAFSKYRRAASLPRLARGNRSFRAYSGALIVKLFLFNDLSNHGFSPSAHLLRASFAVYLVVLSPPSWISNQPAQPVPAWFLVAGVFDIEGVLYGSGVGPSRSCIANQCAIGEVGKSSLRLARALPIASTPKTVTPGIVSIVDSNGKADGAAYLLEGAGHISAPAVRILPRDVVGAATGVESGFDRMKKWPHRSLLVRLRLNEAEPPFGFIHA